MGVLVCHSGTLGEEGSAGYGSIVRVIRDGVPHWDAFARAAGGGDSVREEVTPSMCPVLWAHSTYCCDMSCVLKTTVE